MQILSAVTLALVVYTTIIRARRNYKVNQYAKDRKRKKMQSDTSK